MKTLLAAAIALAGLVAPAYAQTADHPDAAMIEVVGLAFHDDLAKGGMMLVARDINGCYVQAAASGRQDEIRNCMLFDLAAMNLDHGMRQVVMKAGHGDPGPVDPAFSLAAFQARVQEYAPIAFSSWDAIKAYCYGGSDAVSQVLDIAVKEGP